MKMHTDRRGVISIIALGILSLLAIFGVIISKVVVHTFDSVEASNDYHNARDIAESVMEFWEARLTNYEPGYNTPGGWIRCEFEEGELDEEAPEICHNIEGLVVGKTVTVSFRVKGRPLEGEKLAQGPGCDWNDCYTVPLPGTGTAGEKCELYDPYTDEPIVPTNLTGEGFHVPHLDYSCNWNKLEFGSTLLDRAVIPLFYSTTGQERDIVNTFAGEEGGVQLTLRMRTPCMCEEDDLNCSELNKTICRERPDLAVNENDSTEALVSWQINGKCDQEGDLIECGIREYLLMIDGLIDENSSIISTNSINSNESNIMLFRRSNVEDIISQTRINLLGRTSKLPLFQKAIFTLFLNKELKSEEDTSIPYLEYQLITDKPVSLEKRIIEVEVKSRGNIYKATKEIGEQKALIDFAIQN